MKYKRSTGGCHKQEAQCKQPQFKRKDFKELQISKQQESPKKRWLSLSGIFLFA